MLLQEWEVIFIKGYKRTFSFSMSFAVVVFFIDCTKIGWFKSKGSILYNMIQFVPLLKWFRYYFPLLNTSTSTWAHLSLLHQFLTDTHLSTQWRQHPVPDCFFLSFFHLWEGKKKTTIHPSNYLSVHLSPRAQRSSHRIRGDAPVTGCPRKQLLSILH